MRASKIKVLQAVECWLPQTMTWLYNHFRYLAPDIESLVVAQWTQNLDQFPVDHLSSLERRPQAPGLTKRFARSIGAWDENREQLALLQQVIGRSAPSILHSHFGQCGWANAGVARRQGVPHVVSCYGLDISYLPHIDRRWLSRYRRMSDQVDAVLCEGPHMARSIAAAGVDPAKIRVFRLGIDLDRIPFVPRKNLLGAPKRFLIAGSFREKKGIPYALEALGLLSEDCPDIAITVVGDSSGSARDEAEKRKIMELTDQYGLRDRTRFLGYQHYDVLLREFYRHDVFISPSVTAKDGDTEGGAPVTLIEAAASGMPVISTLHCDVPFVLASENQPYLAPERDAAALVHAVHRLLRLADWNPIVSANRCLIESELDVRQQAQKLSQLYRDLSANCA